MAGQAQHEAAAHSSAAPTTAEAAAGLDGSSAAGQAAVGGEGAEVALSQGDGSEADGAAKPAAARRPSLLHPGYFTLGRGPSYTPAPPEALIDARECWCWPASVVAAGSWLGRAGSYAECMCCCARTLPA